jgi:hypothetical protein
MIWRRILISEFATLAQLHCTDAFWKCYASRAGIEGTVSQGVRTSGMRRSRY